MLIECSNIYMEDVFKWFHDHVLDSGGDGASAIICDNHQEASHLFIEWFLKEHPDRTEFYHPVEEYDGIINFHDLNENFIFARHWVDMHAGDYIFLIRDDCHGGWKVNGTLKKAQL